MNPFITVSLRQKAIFIPNVENATINKTLRGTTSVLVANLGKLGYGVSEPLLHALNQTTPAFQANLLEKFREVMGVNKNWTPLVKGWDTPTGETVTDHIITFFVNVFEGRGTTLPCGHIIPANTFPLERYNGCPFCGTPFEFGKVELYGQGSKLKMLELWTEKELKNFFKDLLTSKTALDATQIDSLKILLKELPLPEVSIGMKETLMTVIDICIEQNQPEKAQALFTSPTDILRYLWYKHTGFLQIIEPKTIIQRHKNNNRHTVSLLGNSAKAKLAAKDALKLKYSRKTSSMVAHWLNNLPMDAEKMCEMMHPKRGMWVRFIRALRLAEYSKRAGFEKLKEMMDLFYNQVYEVWQGRVNQFRLRMDQDNTLKLLKQRPGLFARSLFANMLWFGSEPVVEAFAEVIDKVPARLVFTLNMYAENYFTKGFNRVVKPLGGVSKNIPANALLPLYNDDQLDEMKSAVADLCLVAMEKRFAAQETKSKTIYIDPILFKMPVSIGDRSDNVQDLPSALMGTRFPIEGDTVRLFMQWGTGLPAQHMDMDLSCHIAFASRMEFCSYSSLVATGCKHSGDIRSIPNQIGTAEYIEINVNELRKAQAKYVTFTCNAYSNGSITPNLVIGWMNTRFPMKISEQTGVAYDPSCVQYQVRVTNSLAKGMVFGVLDVEAKEVIWLEMPFGGQVVQGLDTRNIESMLKKLDSKLSVGNLLSIKANAQKLQVLETPEADEVYTQQWAMNAAAVTQLLVD
ncbi:hypothetical protein [Xanthocytophaga agilis]|uniref:Prokaryotic RING finger family 4 n=1 Tax=Xanthocytophaga agilis TaxID=3048010 RepID=A0AAE3R2P7_9BACT|nr:hypothetical protein [Xanthocytophaga agilis]MDJ1500229.1 hypothetical protein [Xanthocytophaga agilis]